LIWELAVLVVWPWGGVREPGCCSDRARSAPGGAIGIGVPVRVVAQWLRCTLSAL